MTTPESLPEDEALSGAGAVCEVVDGKIRYDGRSLSEWVPHVVAQLLAASEPLKIVLFGSVARGDDGLDSDLDLLVVLPAVEPARRPQLMADLRAAISARVPVDVFVTDPEELERRKDVIGSLVYWPVREGVVVYERAA